CVGRIVQQVQKMNGIAIITADHGNADQMIYYESRRPHTAHTTNPVPFILFSNKPFKLRNSGILADVAPTILDLLGIDKPLDMTGESLLGVRG
ncbi:MAG: 2,3-bisphosphoglycerate-independent phosphoglycerate mutase, partial [Methanosarcinales archaeon]